MLFYIQSSTFRLFYEVWPTVLIKVVEHKNYDGCRQKSIPKGDVRAI